MEPVETPKAAASFTVYCEMGPERSLAKLAEEMRTKTTLKLHQNYAVFLRFLKRVV